jgi:hypothetical protein
MNNIAAPPEDPAAAAATHDFSPFLFTEPQKLSIKQVLLQRFLVLSS